MTLRTPTYIWMSIVLIAALAACAGGGAGTDRAEPGGGEVTDVTAVPRPGWIEVTWEHQGATAYEIHRETVSGSGAGEIAVRRVEIADGEARAYRDEAVDVDSTYAYAVGVEGSEPTPAAGDAVAPDPGSVLRVEFATAVPTGAQFEAISDPPGIACSAAGGDGCSSGYPVDRNVTVSARAEGVSWSWDGCDAVSDGACSVAMTSDRTVTVTLASANALAVVVTPSAAGTVSSVNDLDPNPPVSCTTECTYAYPAGLAIGLTAQPVDAAQYRFVGWSGACDGDACTVTMDGDRRVEAQFALQPPTIESFTASPESVEQGESSTLSWNVSGGGDVATGELSIEIEPDVGALSSRAGNVDVAPTADTTYTLTVTNASGTVQQTRTVAVGDSGPAPVIEYFTADDEEIDEGGVTWLRWSVAAPGNTEVTIEPGIGSVPRVGERSVSPRADTTYVITASNRHGEATAEFEVEVDEDEDDDDSTGAYASPLP